jgi:hypothetical protein
VGRFQTLRLIVLNKATLPLYFTKIAWRLTAGLGGLLLLGAHPMQAQSNAQPALAFKAGTNGAFGFDTGALRGVLRANGKSVGLQSVTHLASGKRLDQSMGLFSHYRVFTTGQRYGAGAWDWPSTAQLTDRGAVEVLWPATAERPFELRALYRWATPTALDLETVVTARTNLAKFESFLACYFSAGFTNALAATGGDAVPKGTPLYLPARPTAGEWQMFPRDDAAIRVIQDGRWQLPPNPVAWTIRPRFSQPVAIRYDEASQLAAVVMGRRAECFALAMPHETEGHRSLYLAQFGRDLKAGETARAQARLVILDRTHPPRYGQAWLDFNGP